MPIELFKKMAADDKDNNHALILAENCVYWVFFSDDGNIGAVNFNAWAMSTYIME